MVKKLINVIAVAEVSKQSDQLSKLTSSAFAIIPSLPPWLKAGAGAMTAFFCLLTAPAMAGTPPTFIQEAETTWTNNAGSFSTGSFNVNAGDVLVAFVGIENDNNNAAFTVSGGSLTWKKEQEDRPNTNQKGYISIWTATVDSDKSMTVTFNVVSDGSQRAGGNVLTFRGSNGIGNSANNDNGNPGSGAPTLNISTVQNNSTLVVFVDDWNGANGSSRVYNTAAGTFNEQTYNYLAGIYTVYGGYYNDVGTSGSKTIGITTPNTQQYQIVAVEVKGSVFDSSSTGTTIRNAIINNGTVR